MSPPEAARTSEAGDFHLTAAAGACSAGNGALARISDVRELLESGV